VLTTNLPNLEIAEGIGEQTFYVGLTPE